MGVGEEGEETHRAWLHGRAAPSPPRVRAARAVAATTSSDLAAGWTSCDLASVWASSGHDAEQTSCGPLARVRDLAEEPALLRGGSLGRRSTSPGAAGVGRKR